MSRPVHLACPVRQALLTASITLATAAPALAGGGQGSVYEHRPIAVTGQPAPGLAAGSFTTFDFPAINASGQIAFAAETNGATVNSGLWTTRADDPQTLRIIFGDDLFPPGVGPGIRYAEYGCLCFIHPEVGDDGSVSFYASLDGYQTGDPERAGQFDFDGSTVSAVAVPEQAAPGLPGVSFKSISNLGATSTGGLSGFRAMLQGAGVTTSNDEVLLVEWIGGLNMIVREGGAAPQLPGWTWQPEFLFGTPLIGGNGRMTFPVQLSQNGDTLPAIYQGFPGIFEPLLVGGTFLPQAGPFVGFGTAPRLSVNDAGDLAATLSYDSGDQVASAVVRISQGVIETIAAPGVAGPLGAYGTLEPLTPHLGPDGTVVFLARFSGQPVDRDSAIIRKRPGQAAEVMLREGDPAFGQGPGVVYDDMLSIGSRVALDRTGRIHANAFVRGPGINNDNHRGIWSIEPNGLVNLVVRGNQSIQVGPFDSRFVTDAELWAGHGMDSGRRPSVNDRGDVAFLVDFSDGSQGIVHAYLPPDCPVDRNDDGVVDFDDLLIVLADFEQTGPIGTGGDADWDGDTDFDDLLAVLAAFGTVCNPV